MYLKSPDPTNPTMKAYRLDDFTSLDDLRLRHEDDPRPQRGEVRVHALPELPQIAMLSQPLVTELVSLFTQLPACIFQTCGHHAL